MKILLDECMPLPIVAGLSDLGHVVDHATRCGLSGVSNGDVYHHAEAGYDLLVTNDRHFRNPDRFPVSPNLGIVFVRIAPCVTEFVVPPLRRLLIESPPGTLVGRRIVLHRESWQALA